MSWAAAKQLATLDWRAEWTDLARLTSGLCTEDERTVRLQGLAACDQAYRAKDRAGFLAAKAALAKQVSHDRSSTPSTDSQEPTRERSTGASSSRDSLISSPVTTGDLFGSR